MVFRVQHSPIGGRGGGEMRYIFMPREKIFVYMYELVDIQRVFVCTHPDTYSDLAIMEIYGSRSLLAGFFSL